MNWNRLTIGKKITLGFSIVLILLIVVGVMSYTGTLGIVTDAKEVIGGNQLDGILAQKEVDHLNWANRLNALLTDEKITQLQVETDHTKCAFGKWLYGEGRREAESLVPSLAPMLKDIETPHKALHDSAIAIGKVFKQADSSLPGLLIQREVDHLKWAGKIRDAFVQHQDQLGVQTDPTQCALGKWLDTSEAQQAYGKGDADFKKVWDEMVEIHGKLHLSASDIEKRLKYSELEVIFDRKKALHTKFEESSQDFFEVIGKAMGEIIDPAKSRAENSGNASEISLWGPIDMVLNEDVIQAFLKSRLAISDFEHEKNEAFWEKCERELALFSAGLDRWIALAQRAPALSQAMGRLKQIGQSWIKDTGEYHAVIIAQQDAETSIDQAVDLFDTVTIPLLNETMGHLEKLKAEAQHELEGMHESSRIYADQTTPALIRVQALLGELRKEAKAHIMTDQSMLDAAQTTKFSVVVLVSIALVLGVLMSFLVSKGIIRVLSGISTGLGEGASQVAAAAGQVSSSSQAMAEGASGQASAIEETSASMEEMSSMTRKNAENAAHADGLMKETNDVAATACQAMTELIQSMADISSASEETSKIVKTIDEIAFQTNLLALNAAVEAARAGEAGAGFAVVADEVRNLAMRAATAARNTSELIESTVRKVEKGSQLVSRTSEAFEKVSQSAVKVGSLIEEISEASGEQSKGITQVNQAISEMDRVVQQNAANAEESASAAEEMNAQAEQLKEYVEDLLVLVIGKREMTSARIGHSPAKALGAPNKGVAKLGHGRKEIRPDQVIPFSD